MSSIIVNGGPDHSNHVEADGAQPGSPEAMTKSFGLSIYAARYFILYVVHEFVKIRRECALHHNIWGWGDGVLIPYDEMPAECTGTYGKPADDDYRLFCAVQVTPKCKELHDLMNGFVCRLDTLTGKEVTDWVEEITKYKCVDLAIFNEDEFDKLPNYKKEILLKKIEYNFERRETGGCFLCKKDFLTRALRDFGALHGHHISEENKEFNPSECVNMSWEAGRLERKKCCPLCVECHLLVHHNKKKAAQFNDEMARRNYVVKAKGVIVQTKK